MKSIKPGRGPSMMGGIVGIFMIGFGILWTAFAARAGGFFALFGVLWTCIAIAMTVYHFKNATGKSRHSTYDILDADEEPDPLNRRFGDPQPDTQSDTCAGSNFCPYCGTPAASDYAFCRHCGKKLP